MSNPPKRSNESRICSLVQSMILASDGTCVTLSRVDAG